MQPTSPTFTPAARPFPGRALVIGLVLLGLSAAAAGITYQRLQTRRCLAFYGPDVARLITTAPRVELLTLASAGSPGRLVATSGRDVTAAKGLVHLRRGLVEDANFDWREQAASRLPDEAWDLAFRFSDPDRPGAVTTIVVDLADRGGSIAVVGRPGRVALGRIAGGLAKWTKGL